MLEQKSNEKLGSLALANYLYQMSLEDEEREQNYIDSDYFSISDDNPAFNESVQLDGDLPLPPVYLLEERLQNHIDWRIQGIVDEQIRRIEETSQSRMESLINELTSIRKNVERLLQINVERNALVDSTRSKRFQKRSHYYWSTSNDDVSNTDDSDSDFDYRSYYNSGSECDSYSMDDIEEAVL